MSSSKEPTRKGMQQKIIQKQGPSDLLMSSLATKEQKGRYFFAKISSDSFHSISFDWKCVRKLGHEEKMKELLDDLKLRRIVHGKNSLGNIDFNLELLRVQV